MSNAPIKDATRQALRRLAATVNVISLHHNGERMAMAATAVSAVSLDPPSLLVCVNRSASLFAPLTLGAAFCINILARDQQEIAQLCGGGASNAERFGLGDWQASTGDVPMLRAAQANILCTNDAQFIYGTHGIFIGKADCVHLDGAINPLLYVDGRYAAVGA